MIELQRKLLGDSVRNAAFASALKKVIRPGQTVVDIGSGTGFLSFLASQLGAKQSTGYEVGAIVEVSRRLAKRNGIRNCTFHHTHSTKVQKPVKADIVISETLGNYALEENLLETLQDAKRFLKPGGRLIPGALSQFVCPVTAPHLHEEIDVWPRVGFGLDFAEAREVSQNNMYVRTIRPADLLSQPGSVREWDRIDFSKKNKSIRSATESWVFSSPTTVYGFALWWQAELVPGVTLSTSPSDPPTHWEQIFLPLMTPVTLKKGESVELQLTSDTRWAVKINLTWTIRHCLTDGKVHSEQKLDMRKGYLS